MNSIAGLLLILVVVFLNSGCELKFKDGDTVEIEGQVWDLNGELVVQLDKQEPLTLSSLASDPLSFKFSEEVILDTNYVVKITSQPESQFCQITQDSKGTAGAEVKVVIQCEAYYRGLTGVTEVSTGKWHTCAIVNFAVRCWGENRFDQLNVPGLLANPRQISSGDVHTCVLVDTDTGFSCWGEGYTNFKGPAVNLINIKEIQAGTYFATCAIDDNGLVCWGSEQTSLVYNYPQNLTSPHGLVVKHDQACVIDDGQPICWGSKYAINNVPAELEGVSSIALGYDEACAIASGRVHCWGGSDYPRGTLKIVDISSATQLDLNLGSGCALTSSKFSCWGYKFSDLQAFESLISEPKKISLNDHHGCAIDGTELLCIGRGAKSAAEVPEF